MTFFVVFVFGAVIIGAGAMLAPAWQTEEPRIGLAATFNLAIVVGGAVWWAFLFGWDTLIVDYLLFGIVSIVILGGTMAQAQHSNLNDEGEVEDKAWMSNQDKLLFAFIALLCLIPLFILNVPLGDHAPAEAMITLAIRESGSFDTLAPFQTDVTGFAPPGFHALSAYLSQQLRQAVPIIHLAVGSVLAFLCAFTAYDLGSELRDKQLGRFFAIAIILTLAVPYLLIYSYYSQLLAILFTFAFMTYVLRYYRHQKLHDMVAAGLLLGAILFANPILFLISLAGYYLILLILFVTTDKASFSRLGLWLGVLAVCFFGIFPYVL